MGFERGSRPGSSPIPNFPRCPTPLTGRLAQINRIPSKFANLMRPITIMTNNIAVRYQASRVIFKYRGCGAMDNASDYGSEDSRFDSWQARAFCLCLSEIWKSTISCELVLSVFAYMHHYCIPHKLSKKRNIPFSGPCLSKIIRKNPNNFTDLHCKGFKHCFPCLFNEP